MSDPKASLLSDTFSVTFKWKLKDIDRIIFSTAGNDKSEPIVSRRFGNRSWQLHFYPNSGGDNKDYIGLYLFATPTERDKWQEDTDGSRERWTREGLYKLTIAMKPETNDKDIVNISQFLISDHCFSIESQSLGWETFTPRCSIMNPSMVKDTNTLVITATVTHMRPSYVPIPIQLLKSIGNLLNRKDISDVRFIIEPMKKGDKRKVIYAQKPILTYRNEYFQTMFSSSFVEGIEGNTKEVRKSYEPMTTVKVRDESYNTYYAMLYFLYTDKVTFGKIISSKRSETSNERKDSNPDDDEELEEKKKHDISVSDGQSIDLNDKAINMVDDIDSFEEIEDIKKENLLLNNKDVKEIEDYELVYFGHHQPLQISPKALYQLADRYNITELTERCFIYLTQHYLCTQNAFSELVGSFAYKYPSYREVVLKFVLDNWDEILEYEEDFNEVMRGGPSKYIGFFDAWTEIRPRLQLSKI